MDKQFPTEIEGYQEKARGIVRRYVMTKLDVTDPMPDFDVYVVWFCKTLQNWKALISTTLPDSTYYEVTYDGDKRQTYVDVYKKFDNVTVMDQVLQGHVELPSWSRFSHKAS